MHQHICSSYARYSNTFVRHMHGTPTPLFVICTALQHICSLYARHSNTFVVSHMHVTPTPLFVICTVLQHHCSSYVRYSNTIVRHMHGTPNTFVLHIYCTECVHYVYRSPRECVRYVFSFQTTCICNVFTIPTTCVRYTVGCVFSTPTTCVRYAYQQFSNSLYSLSLQYSNSMQTVNKEIWKMILMAPPSSGQATTQAPVEKKSGKYNFTYFLSLLVLWSY